MSHLGSDFSTLLENHLLDVVLQLATIMSREIFNTSPCCNVLSRPRMSSSGVNMHATQTVNFYNFENVFSSQKCKAITDSSWQTHTYDCEGWSHQVKSESTSQSQAISVSKLSFPRFSVAVACCYNGQNWNISSVRNAWHELQQDLIQLSAS